MSHIDITPERKSDNPGRKACWLGAHVFNGCLSLTVYHEIDGNEAYHNGYNYIPTVWNCNTNDIATDGNIYTIIDGVRYAIKDGVARLGRQSQNIITANIFETINYKENSYKVTAIYDSAFSNCLSLTSVYYKGTESDWATITIGAGNSALLKATRYYYSETEPSLNADSTAYNGNYWKYDENGEIVVWEYKKES